MITLRPDLQTNFHKALARPAWISALEKFVADRIQASGMFKTTDGAGTVTSGYNEEKFMGPLSVIKYRFQVDVRVARSEPGSPADRYETAVQYDPESDSFSCLGHEHLFTAETHAKFEADRRRLTEEWIASLEPLESKEEFCRRRCSVCSSPLRPRFFPEGRSWHISCAADARHEPSIWNGVRLDPGGWWTDFVADRTCPRCRSSEKVVGLMYGLVFMEVDPRVWQLGGCSIGFPDPNLWYCRGCKLDFARGAREGRPPQA